MRRNLHKIAGFICLLAFTFTATTSRAQTFGDNLGNHTATDTLRMRGFNILQAGGITIGTYAFLNNSVALQIEATDKALLLSRVSDTSAIANRVDGMLIYSNADHQFYACQAGIWQAFGLTNRGVTAINGKIGSITIAGDTTNTITLSQTGSNITIAAANKVALWNANKLMGKNISAGIPANSQVLMWNDASQSWQPTSMNTLNNLTLPNGAKSDSFVTTLNGALRKIASSDIMFLSDSTSLFSRLAKYSDTTTMLSPYLRSSSGVKYSDTASMLSNRLKISDTSNMLSGYAKSGQLVKYSDTASMVLNLLRKSDTSSMLTNRLKISDTSNMLSGYAKSGQFVKYSDTASMVLNLLRKTDTANMLSPYA
ncbi:hypothetical protein, partial [Asinibacterium sp. OR53]|uniref:hypothetical protein n=1 Tax=Asinibacterium sp. OR53 TaxID=925409 RepID=UPI00056559A5